jgi:hypothetical protein
MTNEAAGLEEHFPPLQHSYRKPEDKKSTDGADAFNEVDEEMLKNMKKQLQDEMGIMKDRIV